jgi:hypothetical protein
VAQGENQDKEILNWLLTPAAECGRFASCVCRKEEHVMKRKSTNPAAAPDQITRKGFLGGIAAAVAAALTFRGSATATSTTAAAPLDIISQSELQSIFDGIEAVQSKVLGFRRRLLAGAKMEPGQRSAYFEPIGYGLRSEEEDRSRWDDFEAYSLRVCSAEMAVHYNNPSSTARRGVPRVEVANA